MKLVASAKLRKAQRAIEGMRPYEEMLNEILSSVSSLCDVASVSSDLNPQTASASGKTVVVAVSSNSSLCGGFNANAVRATIEEISRHEDVEVIPVGRKMSEAVKRLGCTCDQDYSELVGHSSYEKSAALAHKLLDRFNAGEISRVVLVYNHFISTASQKPVVEQYLPFEKPQVQGNASDEDEYIIEPGASEVARELLPQLLMLKFHAAMLDSIAAEHAARTMAMQTATDNAEDLLGELTLEYNKGRQQKITSEILDLVGGATDR